MHGDSVLIVSRDTGLLDAMKEAAPRTRITARSCLADIERVGVNTLLVIDPRVAAECCIDGLSRLRPRASCSGVVYLSLPAEPEILLRLPQVCPGAIKNVSNLLAFLRDRAYVSPARSAWLNRQRLLSPEGRPAWSREFLHAALTRARDGCTVEALAADVSLSERALNRLCRRTFGYPPGLIVDLARIAAIAREIVASPAPLRSIAAAYGYPDEPSLSNQFLRFVGMRPGAYRTRHTPLPSSVPVNPLS